MNYKESEQILGRIQEAKKVVINCHKVPDCDSVGAALSMSEVINSLGIGIETKIICPTEVSSSLDFLRGVGRIETIKFDSFNFNAYDLFLVLDSGSMDMVTGSKEVALSGIPVIVIDHHFTNQNFGEINLVDPKVSSTCEILYWVFQDWKVKMTPDIATYLLSGIFTDTGSFQFPEVTARTFDTAGRLLEEGAERDEIVIGVFRSLEAGLVKLIGEVLRTTKIEEDNEFAWAAISNDIYKENGSHDRVKTLVATTFFQNIRDTNFGVVMIEQEPQKLAVSFRARTDMDVAQMAKELGGGGHRLAAAATISGLSFNEAVKKALYVARKYAKKAS